MIDGYWTIGVPVSPAIVDEDMVLLKRIQVPDGVHLQSAEVVVNGRVWEWRPPSIDGDFGSGSICRAAQIGPLPRTRGASGGRP